MMTFFGGAALVVATLGIKPALLSWAAFVLSTGVIAAVSFVAAWFPAWRGSPLSPLVAIRDRPS
jgi:ABC-type lipoprotein release transport system permease subunit